MIYPKKFGIAAAATIALTLSSSSAFAESSTTSFKDLSKASSWAQSFIQEAQEKGLLSGDQQGMFYPLQEVSRQEIAMAITKLMQLPVEEISSTTFSDVPNETWSAQAIDAVHNHGWMLGDNNGYFRPKDSVTREELATILTRITQNKDIDSKEEERQLSNLKDEKNISTWAKQSVKSVVFSGLMTGSNGNFYPKQYVLRQELAAILIRLDSQNSVSNLQFIQKINDENVIIGDKTYQVADNLKALFTSKNEPVLQNAGIQFKAKNGVITQVLELKLVTPGKAAVSGKPEFSGNLVLDGGKISVEKDLTVAADYITIKNISIKGNLEISSEVNNDFYAEQVSVLGTTYVNGGDDNTVVFDQSNLQNMRIAKEDVRVESINKTVVKEVQIESKLSGLWGDNSITYETVSIGPGVQNASLYAHIRNLEVNAGDKEITISGTGHIDSMTIQGSGAINVQNAKVIGTVNVNERSAKVSLPANVIVQKIVLPEGVSPEQVILNYDKVKSQIATINGTPNPSYTPPVTGGGGSSNSGGNGGSSGGTSPSNPGTHPTTPTNPIPSTGYPFIEGTSYQNRMETSADGLVTVNQTGTIYYMAVRLDDNVRPTAEQIKNGTLTEDVPFATGVVQATANQLTTFKIEGLEQSKAYGIWAVFKNSDTGEETKPSYIMSVSNYLPNSEDILPFKKKNLEQIRIQFTGVLTPPITSVTDPSAIVEGGHLRNYGYGFIEINSIEWDLTIPDMPILNLNFDPVTLGDGTSYRLDWTYVKNALSIKFTSSNGTPTAHGFGGFGTYTGPEVVNLITKQLAIEIGSIVDPTQAEEVMHLLEAYPSPLKQELGLIEFNAQYYQKALAEQAGKYTTYSDVKEIVEAVNQQYPAPSTNEATAIRSLNSAQSASLMESYIKRYAAALNIDVTAFNNLNAASRIEIGQIILEYREQLPQGEFTSIAQIRSYYDLAYEVASSAPTTLNFLDTDTRVGLIGGDVVWTPGVNEEKVSSYEIIWGSQGREIASINRVDKDGSNRYTIAEGTAIPEGATQLLVRALLQDGTETAPIYITLKDTLPAAPEQPSIDNDDAKNILIGADSTMEFSVDGGTNWHKYDEENPPIFPGRVFVQVRVQADPVNQVPAGKAKTVSFVDNVVMYAGINDVSNTFDTNYISSAMEYSSDNGETWTTYDENNPPQFPGDLTILLREKGGQYLPAAPAKSFTFKSKVNIFKGGNTLSASTSAIEYSKNGEEWIKFVPQQVVTFQPGDSVDVREAAYGSFPAGAVETITFD
ncbi:DUF4073 domain-containing protein [Paenibacillus sp. JNUCC31]|uniref:DUF4073 domain-containing protein n=1 Tax=Paenibacillus sp. JNUCC-31 TaxID=2777983 RepID=UPI00177AE2B1|nr:DUF4073 domain-containing protein [Paenibacillus sp. JNUCC-31]QOS82205.1 DUF4073 domain-containing protein [Paenibacillus sp. JNUCC-31]